MRFEHLIRAHVKAMCCGTVAAAADDDNHFVRFCYGVPVIYVDPDGPAVSAMCLAGSCRDVYVLEHNPGSLAVRAGGCCCGRWISWLDGYYVI
jgi:hypothetical protein